MSASFTVGGQTFPSGTSVSVYPRAAKKQGQAPVGSSVASATAGPSSVAFTGLAFDTRYAAYALVGGQHLYVDFATDSDPSLQFATKADVTAAAAAAAALPGYYVVTASPYNADATGVADSTTGIQAAINAAKAAGGTVYFPPGVYKITSALVCDNDASKAIRLTGPGGLIHYDSTNVAAVIRYTGTGVAIQCYSVTSFELDHLKIECSNVAHTGDIVDVDGNPHASDCQLWEIHHCGISTASTSTRSAIRLNKAIIGSVHHNHLTGGQNPLRIGDPGGAYVVSVDVYDNTYNFAQDGHILVGSGDAESITIRRETFEGMPTNGAIHGSSCLAYNMHIDDCWFGDASASSGTWINGLAAGNFGGLITACRMADPGGPTAAHFNLTGQWTLIANSCESGMIFRGSSLNATLIGNDFNTPTSIWNAGEPTAGFVALGNVTPDTAKMYDRLPNRLAFGAQGAVPPGPLGTGNANEALVIGATNDGTLVTLGGKGALYMLANSGLPITTVVQAPTDNAAREVVLAAGTTPAPVVRVSGAKLGLYNVAPVAQAARAGQLTDSTGGTVSSTLAAGITDAVAKNAIASLAAKVNALETIIHNLGASA